MNSPDPAFAPPPLRGAFEHAARTHATARLPAGAGQITTPPEPPQTTARTASGGVEQAIANAARRTTIDFDFLVAQAEVESSMNPEARARTSSATGLYQFIESTWLGTLHRHGERFGLGDVAAQIEMGSNGQARVSNPEARAAILALRRDPEIASLMAAGLAEDNRAHLTPILGRQPNHGELYLAHFLGAGGAGRFLSAMADNPNQSAAALFRTPAAANRPVFYDSSGAPRSLAGVMQYLSAKIERAGADAGDPTDYLPITPPITPHSVPQFAAARFAPQPTSFGGAQALGLAAEPSPIPQRGSMSGLLRDTFGDVLQAGSAGSQAQVRRAYEQLRVLGL